MQTLEVIAPDFDDTPVAFGRFEVRAEIGRGGMGVVYRAWDPELQREIAVKRLRVSGMARADIGDLEQRLVREARAMAAVSHDNLLPIFDVGRCGGDIFIALELVDGVTLREWLESTRTWREILEIFLAAGRGLAGAHARHLVHRDFKPSNVLIGYDGRVRVADFGLARLVGDDGSGSGGTFASGSGGASSDSTPGGSPSTQITRAGEVIGTPRYMAPEQYRGTELGPAADQYAFCVALFEALAGRPPFADTGRALLRAKLALAITVPSGSAAPMSVWRALVRGLAVRPSERFASMDVLVDRLGLALRAPSRRRLAFGGTLVCGGVLWWGGLDAPPEGCTDDLVEVWNDARRAELTATITGDGPAFRADVAARVLQRLETYAANLDDARLQVCAASDVDTERRDARLECLGYRRAALTAMVDALARGEVSATHAVQATAGLPPSDGCLDEGAASGGSIDPREVAAAAAIREELAVARAAIESGRYEHARRELEALRSRTERIDAPLTLARVLHALGSAQQRCGQLAAARESLEQAYLMAREHRDDDGAADSLALLVHLIGYLDRDPAAMRQWLPLAEQEALRPDLPAQQRATLLNHLGAVYEDTGDYRRARGTWEQAVELVERELDGDPLELGPLLNNLGNTWSDEGRAEEALDLGLRSLTLKEDALGPMHPSVGFSLNNLGVTYSQLGRSDDALAAHQRALALRVDVHGESHVDVAVSLLNVGVMHRMRGDLELGRAFIERALAIRRDVLPPHHADIGMALHALGDLDATRGDHERARDEFRAALDVLELGVGPQHPTLAYPLSGLGRALVALGRSSEAVPYLERALALRHNASLDPDEIANTSEVLARALWTLGHRSRARAVAQSALVGLLPVGERVAERRAQLETWLAEHSLTEG